MKSWIKDVLAFIYNDLKVVLDTLSLGTAVATLLSYLPAISAILSIIWMTIRILETRTMRRLLNRRFDDHDQF